MNRNAHIRSAAALVCAALTASTAYAAPFAYVANWGENTVVQVDTATGQVVGSAIGVGDKPEAIVVSPDGARVYVANAWGDSISVIDSASQSVVATIDSISNPHSLLLDSTGSRLFVTGGGVEIIDTATNAQVGATILLAPASDQDYCPGSTGPAAINSSATRMYVPTVDSCINSDPFDEPGRIAVIDLQAGVALQLIEVERFPTSVTLDPAGTRLYATNWYEGSVSAIDTASNTVAATIRFGGNYFPIKSAISGDGSRLYVANNGDYSVTVVDTATAGVIGAPIVVGNEPDGIAITSDGSAVYVSNQDSNSLVAIDTATLVAATPIAVGSNPVAVAISRGNGIFAAGFEASATR